jgi:23S rRNA (guanine2445-N2)-methyltransferase / 23S rRNA (guanine2069-N7)-methyltransferase
MCGSGTLPIEAALIATNTAPGLLREKFGFFAWKGHDDALWERLVAEARAQIISDAKLLPRIEGYDADFRAVRLALTHVERAGLRGLVHIEKRAFEAAAPTSGDAVELRPLYKEMGDAFKKRFGGWSAHLLTSSPELAKCVGLKTSARIPLFNGALECRLLGYEMYAGTRKTPVDAISQS